MLLLSPLLRCAACCRRCRQKRCWPLLLAAGCMLTTTSTAHSAARHTHRFDSGSLRSSVLSTSSCRNGIQRPSSNTSISNGSIQHSDAMSCTKGRHMPSACLRSSVGAIPLPPPKRVPLSPPRHVAVCPVHATPPHTHTHHTRDTHLHPASLTHKATPTSIMAACLYLSTLRTILTAT